MLLQVFRLFCRHCASAILGLPRFRAKCSWKPGSPSRSRALSHALSPSNSPMVVVVICPLLSKINSAATRRGGLEQVFLKSEPSRRYERRSSTCLANWPPIRPQSVGYPLYLSGQVAIRTAGPLICCESARGQPHSMTLRAHRDLDFPLLSLNPSLAMFSHVVIFWTDPAQPNAADDLIAGANKFLRPIPGSLHFHVGKMVPSH